MIVGKYEALTREMLRMSSEGSRIKQAAAKILPTPMASELREIGALQKDIKALDGRIRRQNEKLNEVSKKLDDVISRLDALAKTGEANARRIEANGDRLSGQMFRFLDPALYEHVLKQWFMDRTGQPLDLEHPEGYNAKIQWLKLHHEGEDWTLLADKYSVRGWVRERVGEKYLVPLLGVWHSAEEIDFDSLPERFVLKANHGSGMNAVVRSKSSEDLEALRRRADLWLHTDYTYHYGLETQYANIPRRVIAEQYLENSDGDLPDYKFWCFDGVVRYIQVINQRRTGPHMAFFEPDWTRTPFTDDYPPIEGDVEKPPELDEMLAVAAKLGAGFRHVRVDLYGLDDGEIKFGEMTFTTASGICPWEPPEADLTVGAWLKVP